MSWGYSARRVDLRSPGYDPFLHDLTDRRAKILEFFRDQISGPAAALEGHTDITAGREAKVPSPGPAALHRDPVTADRAIVMQDSRVQEWWRFN